MSQTNRRKIVPKILAVFFVAAGIFSVFLFFNDATRGEGRKEGWASIIEDIGPEKAFEKFKAETEIKSFIQQHAAAHDFGEALYKTSGIDGVTICDSGFGFGCQHQYFFSAITDRGSAIIPLLDKACIEKFTFGGQGCQHGIGHGIVEYFGHSLDDALSACAAMAWQKPLFGCQGGVFMEYNFPTFIDERGAKRESRKFVPDEPFEPCFDIPDRFKISCIFAQAEWWDKATPLTYDEQARWCLTLKEEKLRDFCLIGIGASAVSSNAFDAERVFADCKEIFDPHAQMLCRSGAYWGFYDASPNFKDAASRMCEDRNSLREEKCQKDARIDLL